MASTKGFSATGFVFELLSLALADECGTITDAERSTFVTWFSEVFSRGKRLKHVEAIYLNKSHSICDVGADA